MCPENIILFLDTITMTFFYTGMHSNVFGGLGIFCIPDSYLLYQYTLYHHLCILFSGEKEINPQSARSIIENIVCSMYIILLSLI